MRERMFKCSSYTRACLTMLLLFFTTAILAQNISVRGSVKDEQGEPIIGANVIIKGTTTGAMTDVHGNYTVKCASNAVLEFSYIGMEKVSIPVQGKKIINVVLKESTHSLNEVVVTALGIKRETKALGYAATEVNTDEIKAANTISPVAALQGKVAGVEINQSDGGMFGSTKIQIRGASTLSQNNQPIYVIDGVILDNPSSNTGDADWDSNINDYGNQLKNLNPDDFASLTVLKGAAATALYGSRGLHGAIVITTKSGKSGQGIGVSFSQTFGIDRVYKAPDLQNEYVEGAIPGYALYGDLYNSTGNRWDTNAYSKNSSGNYSMIEQNDVNSYAAGWSWGPNISWFKGKQVEQYDGTMGEMKIYKDNYKDAYRNGFNTNTHVAVQGGNETTTFYTSLSYKYASGTTPRNTFDRLSFLAKASHHITKNVILEASIDFANSTPRNAQNNIGEAFANGTFMREYDVNKYKHLYKGTHGGMASSAYGDLYRSVPGKDVWWSIYENNYQQKETSVRPTLDLTYNITPWLTFRAGANYNYYYIRGENKQLGSGYANEGGYYALTSSTTEQTNAYASALFNKQINQDFEVHGFLRGEYYNQTAQYNSANTEGGLIVPGQYFITNSKNQADFSAYKFNTKRIVSYIFQVGASWKNQLFMDITGRNDWSSALVYTNGTGNFSYFYPSVSGSWIASETLRKYLPEWVTFAKIRASWAQVGNDTDPYYINSGYTLNSTTFNSGKIYSLSLPSQIKSTNLKPERKNSWEVGIDWRFLNNRIGIDATYYKENTKNQIMSISVPYYSGVSTELINAGNIQNSGLELSLNTTPYKNRDWEWDLNFTYTRNKDKIVSLSKDVANYIVLDGDPAYGNYRIGSVAKVGGSYGLLMSDSKPAIDPTTKLPILSYSNTLHTAYNRRSGTVEEVGSMLPDFLGSVNTSLKYKNLSVHVALDCRFGGYVASYNSRYATAYGFSGTSLNYRKGLEWTSNFSDCKGMSFSDGFIPNGVFASGTTVTTATGASVDVSGKTYKECYEAGIVEPNHLSNYAYYTNSWGSGVINDNWLKKLNYIALREISISYTLPVSLASKFMARSLSVSLVGRNLGYLLNTAPNHENPESIRGTGASQFRMRSFSPYTANYMFSINASF